MNGNEPRPQNPFVAQGHNLHSRCVRLAILRLHSVHFTGNDAYANSSKLSQIPKRARNNCGFRIKSSHCDHMGWVADMHGPHHWSGGCVLRIQSLLDPISSRSPHSYGQTPPFEPSKFIPFIRKLAPQKGTANAIRIGPIVAV